jgi:thiol-disulfide isomerase/thioredoxin
MQKLIVFISSILLLLTSCKTEVNNKEIHNGFSITGVLSNTSKSFVYLINDQNVKIDSSKVIGNQFYFKGFVKSPIKHQLQLQNDSKRHAIILENSNYTILINDGIAVISGGNLNTKQVLFKSLNTNLDTKKLASLNTFINGDIKPDSLRKAITSIEFNRKKITTDYIINNANNVLSSTLFLEMETKNFSLETLKSILNNTDIVKTAEFKSLLDEEIIRLEKNIAIKLAEKEKIAAAKKAYRKPAIMFSGDGLNRELISLKSVIKGKKVILIDFWASWCGPCRMVTPRVRQLYNKYKNKGFTILTISEDKTREDWKKGIEQDNMLSWYHIFDDYGRISSMYGVRTIPYMVLIDGNGNIIKEKISITELEYQLKKLL